MKALISLHIFGIISGFFVLVRLLCALAFWKRNIDDSFHTELIHCLNYTFTISISLEMPEIWFCSFFDVFRVCYFLLAEKKSAFCLYSMLFQYFHKLLLGALIKGRFIIFGWPELVSRSHKVTFWKDFSSEVLGQIVTIFHI